MGLASGERRQLIAIVLGFVAVSGPALIAWEFPDALALATRLAIAAVGGALAGGLLTPPGERLRAHAVTLSCGALAGLGAHAVTAWWLHGRESTMSAVLMLIALIGALPGVVLGIALFERVRRPDERVPTATARQR